MTSTRFRSWHATAVAWTALAVALGGTASAAAPVAAVSSTARSASAAAPITGANIKDGSITGADVKNGSITGADVKDGSLTGADIKKGSVPLDRLKGSLPSGAVDAYTKAQSDARYLSKTGKAADADTIDGVDSSALARGNVTTTSRQTIVPLGTTMQLATVPGWATVSSLNCTSAQANAQITITSPTAVNVWGESSANPAGFFATGVASGGTPLAANAWYRMTIGQVAGSGDTSATATIEIHSAATPAGCRYVVTSQLTN